MFESFGRGLMPLILDELRREFVAAAPKGHVDLVRPRTQGRATKYVPVPEEQIARLSNKLLPGMCFRFVSGKQAVKVTSEDEKPDENDTEINDSLARLFYADGRKAYASEMVEYVMTSLGKKPARIRP